MPGQAPVVIANENLTPLQVPNLPSGQEAYAARINGARQIQAAASGAAAAIGGELATGGGSAASAGLDRAIASDGMALGQQIMQAANETRKKTATTDYIKGRAALYDEFENSSPTDWEQAAKDFGDKLTALRTDTFAKFGAQDQAVMAADLVRSDISTQRDAHNTALSKMTDKSAADADARYGSYLSRAAAAKSAADRQAVYDDFDADQADRVGNGLLSADAAVKKKLAFHQTVDHSDVMTLIQKDPAAASKALQSDANFAPGLTPIERQNYAQQAQGAYGQQQTLRAGDLTKRDPAAGAALYGTMNAGQAANVYYRAIIPHESGGDAKIIGASGEVGLGQLMLGTARGQARKLGMDDVASLSDADLTEALKNPVLNMKLGQAEWQDQVKKFNGNLWAAIAGYNAAPKLAEKWNADAIAKFGDHPSAAQFASIVTVPGTRGYIFDVAKRLGADPGAPDVSFAGSYQRAGAVDAELQTEAAQRKRDLQALISAGSDDRDAVTSLFKNGYAADPAQVTALRAPLVAAAAAGDAEATQKLRRFDDIKAAAPLVSQAYQASPQVLEAEIAQLRNLVATPGGAQQLQAQRRLDLLTSVQGEVDRLAKTDPVQLYERANPGQRPTIVSAPQQPNDPGFADQLAARVPVAIAANARIGGPQVAPLVMLKPQEAAGLQQTYAAYGDDAKVAFLGQAARALPGPAYRAFAGQVTNNDPLSVNVGILAARDPQLARDILAGSALKAQDEKLSPKKADKDAAIERSMPAPDFPDTAGRGNAIAAAEALYAKASADAGDTSQGFNQSRWDTAIDKVTGGIVAYRGSRVVVPRPGMSGDDFHGIMKNLTDADFAGARLANGAAFPAAEIKPSLFGNSTGWRLQSIDDGKYLVFSGDAESRKYLSAAGRKDRAAPGAGGAFILDLSKKEPPRAALGVSYSTGWTP